MSQKPIAYLQGRDSLSFYIDNGLKVISKTHVNYHRIVDTLNRGDLEAVRPLLVSVHQSIADSSDGSIKYRDGNLYFEGEPLHTSMVPRIISLLRDGFDVRPLTNFLRNVLDNPSARAREELYGFMEVNNLPVTPDGHFIAYKMVRADFTDIRTGKMDNSPGATPHMKRDEVDPDKHQTCSIGLHFASLEYVVKGGYGSKDNGHRLVAVKINPRDVVAIPTDYNNSKGRACQYLILKELDWDSRLPVNTAGFRVFEDDLAGGAGDDFALTPDDGTPAKAGTSQYSDADIRRVKRLLKEPDASLTGIARETGMSRRHIARIRDGEIGAHIVV